MAYRLCGYFVNRALRLSALKRMGAAPFYFSVASKRVRRHGWIGGHGQGAVISCIPGMGGPLFHFFSDLTVEYALW